MKNNTEWEELIQQTKNIEASENAPKLPIIDEAKKRREEKENGKIKEIFFRNFGNIFKGRRNITSGSHPNTINWYL